MYNRRLRSGHGNFIILDNMRASRDLTSHLLNLGHRRIGFIASSRETSMATDPLRGYREALRTGNFQLERSVKQPGSLRPGSCIGPPRKAISQDLAPRG